MDDHQVLADERHAWLLDRLFEDRRLTTNDAAGSLGVSVDTIRRDLRALHDRGLLRRVHGGAVPISRLPTSFTGRAADASPGRTALAAATVAQFREGQVIGLDAGSTCAEIAALLPRTLAITIVTNNPVAAVALADHPTAEVILLGGTVDRTWMATTGPDTVDAWRTYRLDLAVLGVCGLHPEVGATTNSANEVATKRALIEAAAHVIVPVQTEKLHETAPFIVGPVDLIGTLVVDRLAPPTLLQAYRAAGLEVVTP